MALVSKLETEVEIKSAANKFYNIFRSQTHHIPNICSDKIHKIEVHEGDWEALGSVKQWSYTIYRRKYSLLRRQWKRLMRKTSRSHSINVLDCEILKQYNSLKSTVQVTAIKDEAGSLVKWTLVYKKLKEDIPAPDAYLNLAVNIAKDIDAHLLKA